MSSPSAPKSPSKSPPKATSPKGASSPPKTASPGSPSSPHGNNPTEQETEIEVDDHASIISDATAVTDTTSLKSSILKYKWENGRRYHAYEDGSYWGPNDDKQQEAEDLFHEMFRLILDGKLHHIPDLKDPQSVLDVGCGTGAWAVDFADEHPAAVVNGIDLSAIQPSYVPPNCIFEIDDVNKEWTWPVDNFDFIHVRAMTGCIDNLVEFYQQVHRHLKPGGWVQQIELSAVAKSDDGTIKPGSPLETWAEVFEKMSAAIGKTFFACEEACQALQDAGGFVNIHERRLKLPIGTWPKDKRLKTWGMWNRQFLLQGLEGFSIRGLTSMLGWSYEATQLLLVEMRQALTDPNIHSYIEMCIVYGQKPE